MLQGTHAAAANLALSVTVQGLGPRLRLLISLANEGQELVTGLQVLVLAASGDRGALRVHTPHFVVPNLVPMLHYTYMVRPQNNRCKGAARVLDAALPCSHFLALSLA